MWEGINTLIKNGESIESNNYQYTILELINDGASVVYKAKRDDGEIIFLKHYKDPNEQQDDWSDFVKFQNTIFTMLQDIQDAVEINYEFFEYKGYHFQAKKYETIQDLNKTIWPDGDNNMPIMDRFSLVLVLLSKLDIVHKKGIVHSDLKPHQFLVEEDTSSKAGWNVIVIDFDHCIVPSFNLSRPAGTAEWRSPEHLESKNIGFHSDVFTMGQIIYTIITKGKQPYGHSLGDNDTYDNDIKSKKGYKPLNDIFKGGLPQDISDTIDDMMHPDYNKRPTIEKVYETIYSSLNTPPKPKTIILKSNGKQRIIYKNEIITREIVKSSFRNHKDIYNKQFEIIKDNNGDWFIKGHNVPESAKDAKGNKLTFYKTKHNGKDITNKFSQIEDKDVVLVGSTEFIIETK